MKKQVGNLLTAIRVHCLSCAGSAAEVKYCEAKDCTLHRYRLGGNPYYRAKAQRKSQESHAAGPG